METLNVASLPKQGFRGKLKRIGEVLPTISHEEMHLL